MKTLIIGYYNHNNFGDDMYKISFPSLLKASKEIEFVNIDDLMRINWRNYDILVFGGGDIMCSYFLNKFKKWYNEVQPKIPCHAYSFGLPFLSILEEGHLDIFDYFICRNRDDTEILKNRYGKDYVEYLPDFVFNEIISNNQPKIESDKPIISIFPAAQCYKPNTIKKVASFIEQYKDLYKFIAYPMDTDANSNCNDIHISGKIKAFAPSLEIYQGPYDFDNIIRLLHSSYYSICTRLHAHIFSIMTGTPFISLFSTRKVRNLLDDFKLNELGTPMFLECEYCKQTTQPPNSNSNIKNSKEGCPSCRQMCGKPIDMNLDQLQDLHKKITSNHKKISEHLFTIAINNRYLLTKSSHKLPSLIKRSTPPFYLDNQAIEQKKLGLTKDIVTYVNKSLNNPIKENQVEKDANDLLKGSKKISDIYRENNKNKFDKKELTDLELELADLIGYKLSGKIRPDFHYGLAEQIVDDNYNLDKSLDYLIKHQSKSRSVNVSDQYINHLSKFDMHKINQEKLENIHYSGWSYVVNHLYLRMHNPRGIMLNAFIDRTFHWEYDFNMKMGIIPYKEPWTGFLHHALDENYSEYNCRKLFEKQGFLDSLKFCSGIYVFSKYLKSWLLEALRSKGYNHIIVENLIHPTASPQIKFNFFKFRNNRYKSIVQIGGWYRNSYAIYDLHTKLNKIALKGSGNENYFKPKDFNFDDILEIDKSINYPNCGPCGHDQACGHNQGSGHTNNQNPYKCNKYMTGMVDMLKRKHQSVEIMESVDNLSYDHLLSQNIVFLELVDCSVSNTVIECIVRNTPILINPHPAVVELLGTKYPFYYKNLEDASNKSNDLYLIQLTHYYLKSLNKEIYEMDYFIESLEKSKIHNSIKLPSNNTKNNFKTDYKSNIGLEIQDSEYEDHDYGSGNESPTSDSI
jgi:hypothetical protein